MTTMYIPGRFYVAKEPEILDPLVQALEMIILTLQMNPKNK